MCKVSLSDSLPVSAKEKKRLAMEAEIDAFVSTREWERRSDFEAVNKEMTIVCDQGCVRQMTWKNLRRTKICSECRRFNPEKVTAMFVERNWTVRYLPENSQGLIGFTCDQGHDHEISLGNFRKKLGCYWCSDQVPPTDDEVSALFAANNWIQKSKYVNSKIEMDFICEYGHPWKIRYDHLKDGVGCGGCIEVTEEIVDAELATRGWTRREPFEGVKIPIQYTCDRGDDYYMLWNNLVRGAQCRICCDMNFIKSPEEVERIRIERGWKKVKYTNMRTRVYFTCGEDHEHFMSPDSFFTGTLCGQCHPRYGYNPSVPGTLYYVRFDLPGKSLWKIGITSKTVKHRFALEPTPHTIIWERRYEDGELPPKLERAILRKHKEY
jgi:hypothetical protein